MTKFLRSIGDAYLRWRHSHGFGVHSPFAYSLVKRAVRPGRKYKFYGYRYIDELLSDKDLEWYPGIRRDAKFLLRLLVALGVKRMIYYHDWDTAFYEAGNGAGVVVYPADLRQLPEPKPNDFILFMSECDDNEAIERLLADGTPVMAIFPSDSMKRILMQYDKNGVRFEGKRITLVVPNPDVAFVAYKMRF